jgi:hypothetical protein
MAYMCPLCNLLPNSHSLKKIIETENTIYYYTCPSEAILYYDVKGIINHYNGVLSEIPKNKEWIWIFDSFGFNLKHALETKVAIEMARLITNKFSNNLKKIIIINPTFYITITHKFLLPFLSEKVKNIIDINYQAKKWEDIIIL